MNSLKNFLFMEFALELKKNSNTLRVVGVKKSNFSGICSLFYTQSITRLNSQANARISGKPYENQITSLSIG